MSLEFYDGFDEYNSVTQLVRVWGAGSNTNGFSTGRFGGGAINLFNNSCITTLPSGSLATRVVGFAYMTTAALANGILCAFFDSGTTQVELRTTTSGALQVTRNGTVLGTSATGIIVPNVWAYIEFKVKIDPTTGTYEVHVGPSSVLSGTGANTRNTANSSANQFKLQGPSASSQQNFDDVYVCNTSGSVNNDFLGESRILTSLPTGDGATTNWTPSTGVNHWANVDDATPNDDTDYNSSANVGDIDLYTFPTVTPTGAIAGVSTTITARKDDAGTRQISEQSRSAGTTYTGANTFTMASTYTANTEIRETDPATGVAWTNSGLAAQLGVKVIT